MEIKLIIIRTSDPNMLADFYSNLGLEFDYHKHGNSPMHYSTKIGQMILEIYPLAKNQIEADKNLRLGFVSDNFNATLEILKSKSILYTEPTETEFGILTIITDPDGLRSSYIKNNCK